MSDCFCSGRLGSPTTAICTRERLRTQTRSIGSDASAVLTDVGGLEGSGKLFQALGHIGRLRSWDLVSVKDEGRNRTGAHQQSCQVAQLCPQASLYPSCCQETSSTLGAGLPTSAHASRKSPHGSIQIHHSWMLGHPRSSPVDNQD